MRYVETGSNPPEPSSEVAVQPAAAFTIGGRDLAALAARRTAGESFDREDVELMARGVPENTRLAIRRDWMKLLRWQEQTGYDLVPMPVETCVKWIRHNWTMPGRYGRPASPETVKRSLWVITKAHRVAMRPDGTRGYVSPVGSEDVQRALRGYIHDYLAAGHRPDDATAITPEELTDLVAVSDVRAPDGLRDALAWTLMYDMGARASEALAVAWHDVEVHVAGLRDLDLSGVLPADVPLTGGGDHLVVHVPESKTDHEGRGDEVFLYAHPARSAATCPVRHLLVWRHLLTGRDVPLIGTVLRRVATGGRRPKDGRPRSAQVTCEPMEYENLVRAYLRCVNAAGLDQVEGRRRHFALHGLRAGSAEAAADAGADVPELNRHYRWSQRGNTASRYAARARRRRQNPARRIWGDEADRAQASTADGAGLS